MKNPTDFMPNPIASNKALIAKWRSALYDFDAANALKMLDSLAAPDFAARMAEPWGSFVATKPFFVATYGALSRAMPDLERRDWLVVAGSDEHGHDWVGCGGHYMGTFVNPLLDVTPTGHVAHMRFHEFYRIVDGKIAEVQALWDLPELMIQAGAWPLAPSLGREFLVPGPAPQDGLSAFPDDPKKAAATRQHIVDMLTYLKKYPSQGGPEVMEMERFWHEKFNWYGPAGIGTGRGVRGFRQWHQIPFINAMPDRGQYVDDITYHFFAEGPYAAVTGWPNMIQTLTHDGWLGIAPAGTRITMRSLDFWRVENKLIRENWVMVDLIDMYTQIGVDVLARMREFNKAKQGFDPETGRAI
ncbi:MAG: ester cyclase [Pseudomonadota bacterium]